MSVLPDYLAPGLDAIFVGTAVANRSAARGHYYSGPGNAFWDLLHWAHMTAEPLGPDRDGEILRYRLGLTDLAQQVSASSDRDLGVADFDIAGFERKVERYRPRLVVFHGKTAAKAYLRGSGQRVGQVTLGRQTWNVVGVNAFVVPSASGSNRNAAYLDGKSSRLAWFESLADTIRRVKAEPVVAK